VIHRRLRHITEKLLPFTQHRVLSTLIFSPAIYVGVIAYLWWRRWAIFFAYLFGGKAIMYFTTYVLGIVIAGLPVFRKKDNIHFNSLGASGGLIHCVLCHILNR
jgi:uncharacterized membrane protein YjjP (DUF1212 family)